MEQRRNDLGGDKQIQWVSFVVSRHPNVLNKTRRVNDVIALLNFHVVLEFCPHIKITTG